jgi:hypothetical protein
MWLPPDAGGSFDVRSARRREQDERRTGTETSMSVFTVLLPNRQLDAYLARIADRPLWPGGGAERPVCRGRS